MESSEYLRSIGWLIALLITLWVGLRLLSHRTVQQWIHQHPLRRSLSQHDGKMVVVERCYLDQHRSIVMVRAMQHDIIILLAPNREIVLGTFSNNSALYTHSSSCESPL